jgi:hypothetical protein
MQNSPASDCSIDQESADMCPGQLSLAELYVLDPLFTALAGPVD